MNIIEKIASNLALKPSQILAAVKLLDEGATVPFIARYRKEVTNNLTDKDLRELQEQVTYLRELEERKEVILNSISKQGKLTAEMEKLLKEADNKARLEDLYLPYKPKRRTKAQIAREAGLGDLADKLWREPTLDPLNLAINFINEEYGISDTASALEGARQILMEIWSENPELTTLLREFLWANAVVKCNAIQGKEEDGKKFADYFGYQEGLKRIPSHRALAIFRGRREKILKVSLELPENQQNYAQQTIAAYFKIENKGRPADAWLLETVHWTWQIKLFTRLESDLMSRLREEAQLQAIQVFSNNLKDLLMASPAGAKLPWDWILVSALVLRLPSLMKQENY